MKKALPASRIVLKKSEISEELKISTVKNPDRSPINFK